MLKIEDYEHQSGIAPKTAVGYAHLGVAWPTRRDQIPQRGKRKSRQPPSKTKGRWRRMMRSNSSEAGS
jgi:hypothetical protein